MVSDGYVGETANADSEGGEGLVHARLRRRPV